MPSKFEKDTTRRGPGRSEVPRRPSGGGRPDGSGHQTRLSQDFK